jgi:hypothetical protein
MLDGLTTTMTVRMNAKAAEIAAPLKRESQVSRDKPPLVVPPALDPRASARLRKACSHKVSVPSCDPCAWLLPAHVISPLNTNNPQRLHMHRLAGKSGTWAASTHLLNSCHAVQCLTRLYTSPTCPCSLLRSLTPYVPKVRPQKMTEDVTRKPHRMRVLCLQGDTYWWTPVQGSQRYQSQSHSDEHSKYNLGGPCMFAQVHKCRDHWLQQMEDAPLVQGRTGAACAMQARSE